MSWGGDENQGCAGAGAARTDRTRFLAATSALTLTKPLYDDFQVLALTQPFDGFQQVQTYRFKDHADDPGRPITEMRVKSLMVPPGVPDWITRKRCVPPRPVTICGRAWSGGERRITRVELRADDIWQEAEVSAPAHPHAWAGWQAEWQATPGHHTLRCRATDEAGNVQPLDPVWDLAGFANNACHMVEVFVPDQGS